MEVHVSKNSPSGAIPMTTHWRRVQETALLKLHQ